MIHRLNEIRRNKGYWLIILPVEYTGWPKKVSHYRESLLNRIKNRQPG